MTSVTYHRDRNLALTRPCPEPGCHAEEFEPCRRQRGGYRHSLHQSRYTTNKADNPS